MHEQPKFNSKNTNEVTLREELKTYQDELDAINNELDLGLIDEGDLEYISKNQEKIKRGAILGVLIRSTEEKLK